MYPKRILKRSFTHLRNRFLITLDTDGHKLILKCYEGSSENNELVALEDRLLREKVRSVIYNDTDSYLADNALRHPEYISNHVRSMNNIPYPAMPDWDELITNLQETGLVEINICGDLDPILRYLEYRQQPVIHFERKGKHIFVDAHPNSGHINLLLSNLNEEMKELKLLIEIIYDQQYIIERKSKESSYNS